MSSHIEVEIRGPLDKEVNGRLISSREFISILHGENASKFSEEDRLLIDYSTPLEGIGDRKLDVRIRTTNGEAEIIVKRGAMTALGREEASATLADRELGNAVHVLSLLGYGEGIACDRGISRYQIGEIEIAIQDVRYFDNPSCIHSRFYEAEIRTDEAGKDSARSKLLRWLSSHNIPVYTDNEWNQYVELLNRGVNGSFVYGVDSPSLLCRYSSV